MIDLIRSAANARAPAFAPTRWELRRYALARAALIDRYAPVVRGVRMFRARNADLARFNAEASALANRPVQFVPRPIAWGIQQWQ